VTSDIAPEFSCVVRPSALVVEGAKREFDIEATPAECVALALRFGFLALDYFRATVRLGPVRGSGDFRLTGHISARVVQSCVVTLDPVTSEIERDFELLLCEEAGDEDRLAGIEDDFELFSGDAIDIGEVAAVELALSVDPYPRAPAVSGEAPGSGGEDGESGLATKRGEVPGNRPFDALAGLRNRK
jgi:uncharacterized metal-binding protein YceD (DUF177 family)